ncbi:MAG: hypothetical protein ABIG63_07850 [Chloroflexota bacterium]
METIWQRFPKAYRDNSLAHFTNSAGHDQRESQCQACYEIAQARQGGAKEQIEKDVEEVVKALVAMLPEGETPKTKLGAYTEILVEYFTSPHFLQALRNQKNP